VDFLFHLPFFFTASGAVAEILTVCIVKSKKLILNQVKGASHA
jgi:hypothetical protein